MDISSMTALDNIKISATFVYLTEDKFNCEDKIDKLAKRIGYDAAKLQLRNSNGCGIYSERYRYEIDGIRYHSCLCGYRHFGIGFLLELHKRLEQGILPFEGCYVDQPAQVIEILDRITNLKWDKQERELKKQERSLKESKNGRR